MVIHLCRGRFIFSKHYFSQNFQYIFFLQATPPFSPYGKAKWKIPSTYPLNYVSFFLSFSSCLPLWQNRKYMHPHIWLFSIPIIFCHNWICIFYRHAGYFSPQGYKLCNSIIPPPLLHTKKIFFFQMKEKRSRGGGANHPALGGAGRSPAKIFFSLEPRKVYHHRVYSPLFFSLT